MNMTSYYNTATIDEKMDCFDQSFELEWIKQISKLNTFAKCMFVVEVRRRNVSQSSSRPYDILMLSYFIR